ncbi:hypothetical protein I302_102319 [Kwoniella bestiolae CBS 10118]|uniref:Integrase zinc-binding domain-containing protein n=1 Tax=Kwoniella bestiolae CBS 10118 TaxID=1296100 RepID=A0A1B9GEP7_9TREE|nr:hypothetical protein I302_01011 [Kwoniella bestiolae CBS 10118]OCF29504.1 hypothetical protein I302_01011 [Kwoniella bestiolae CBS 10118]
MSTMMARPPPGHPAIAQLPHSHPHIVAQAHPQIHSYPQNNAKAEEFDTFSRSSSHSPVDGTAEELWCDPDDLLAVPIYDALVESTADPLFPSPHKFNLMVQDYLKNLSPKKREKALLTQKMYDAVLSVLQDPKDTSTKTAQFRFWAKKMFQLTTFGTEKVVCHDHKPVAVKEQIYEVLCHCHAQAGHGGRDKTSAQVRRYYSWIPKEIIARFVRDCPFCQSRRTQSSAGFSNMTESQAFLISLQTSDTQLANKRPVSLAQARANAAALGHKPYRRPSIRTIDSCRSRRGSAVSDDGYIHYAGMEGGMEMSSSMSNYDESGDSLYVPSPSYEFPGTSTGGNDEMNMFNQQPQHPPMPRRASSYHEQPLLEVKPLSSENMIRRNSESNILSGTHQTILNQYPAMYSNPSSTNPDLLGGNQFLSVPGCGSFYGGGGLSRTTSSSSLNSLNDDALSVSDLGYFGSAVFDEQKIDEWREGYNPISGSTTPLDGTFNFPMTNLDIPEMGINFLGGNSLSAPPSTYILPVPEFNFDQQQQILLNPSDEPLQLSDGGEMWRGHQQVQDQATLDAMVAVQRMFDQNNIFSLGESAGMTQDQILEMHENNDPSLSTLNMGMREQSISSDSADIPDKSEDELNAELEAISILAMATQTNNGTHDSQYHVSEENLKQMEYVLSQAIISEDLKKNSIPPPTVVIEQPLENSGNDIFLFSTGDNAFPPIMVEEPKSDLQLEAHSQEMDFTQWPEFTLS